MRTLKTSLANCTTTRGVPYLMEFWETESLGAVWEEAYDTGSGSFNVSDGYMFYRILGTAAAADDSRLNSSTRWMVRPVSIGQANSMIDSITFETIVRIYGNLTDIVNAGFFIGFNEAKSNLNTDNNIICFTLGGTDNLVAKTDNDGTEASSGTIAATLTNWNKLKIVVSSNKVEFFLNGVSVFTTTTVANIPDEAMYIVIGTQGDGAQVGIDIANTLCYYNYKED